MCTKYRDAYYTALINGDAIAMAEHLASYDACRANQPKATTAEQAYARMAENG